MPTLTATPTDADLARAAADGDERAFEQLVLAHRPAVLAAATRVIRDRTMAEEIVQEAFLDLWNRPNSFDPSRGSVVAYLTTKVRSRSIDRVRSEQARRGREERQASDQFRTRALEPEVDIDHVQMIAQAVASLGDKQRVAIELAYTHGLTYRQVALRLQEPEGTIKGRIRGGLLQLRAILDDSPDPSLFAA